MGTDFTNELYDLHHGNVSEIYSEWPAPDLIISDGAYGVRGFRGDTADVAGLVDWYQPHVLEWAKAAKPSTSLWFWNTEVGWATVHPGILAMINLLMEAFVLRTPSFKKGLGIIGFSFKL